MIGIRAYELTERAKENDGSTYFKMYIDDEYRAAGSVLDAYFGMVNIPVAGDGFVMLSDFVHGYRDKNVTFVIVSEKEYKVCVFSDYVIRNKYDEMPEEYALKF